MKHILLIGTGGTIASRKGEDGLAPALGGAELLEYVPDVQRFCNVDTVQVMNIDSTNMQPADWLTIARTIEDNYDGYDGFVICHGTDTMAYTAAALSYLIQDCPKPVVVTGSQRPIDLDDTDARTNLTDSLRFASCGRAYGVSIVFDGKVIAGTRARKERTKSYNAFSSINFPYIAVIQGERVLFYIDDKPDRVTGNGKARFYHELNDRVCLLKLIPSVRADVLDYMAAHYDGVVIESFGVGGLPNYDSGDFYKAVERWVTAGRIIIMSTQVAEEGSDMSVYEVGRRIKNTFGLIECYDMTLEASVTKLMWILGQTREPGRVREMFYSTVNHDILWEADE